MMCHFAQITPKARMIHARTRFTVAIPSHETSKINNLRLS